jgi:hypothetical protein
MTTDLTVVDVENKDTGTDAAQTKPSYKPHWRLKLNYNHLQVIFNQVEMGMKHADAYQAVYKGCERSTAIRQAHLLNTTNPTFIAERDKRIAAREARIIAEQRAVTADGIEIGATLSTSFRGASLKHFLQPDGSLDVRPNNPHIDAVKEYEENTVEDLEGNVLHRRRKIKLADRVPIAAELNKMQGNYAPEKRAIAGRIELLIGFVDRPAVGGGE